jgi:hypothetical protein
MATWKVLEANVISVGEILIGIDRRKFKSITTLLSKLISTFHTVPKDKAVLYDAGTQRKKEMALEKVTEALLKTLNQNLKEQMTDNEKNQIYQAMEWVYFKIKKDHRLNRRKVQDSLDRFWVGMLAI